VVAAPVIDEYETDLRVAQEFEKLIGAKAMLLVVARHDDHH
jgi:hypothetical protein